MPNTVIITGNATNFTFDYNSIVKDYAFNDLNMFYDTSAGNVEIWITERNTDEKMFAIKSTDNVTVEGVNTFAGIEEIYNALRNLIFG